MTLAISARRNLAIALAFVVALAGLTLAPAAAPAHAAANSSYTAAFLKIVNKKRTDAGKPAFLANEYLTKFAKEVVALDAKNSSAEPKTQIPAGAVAADDAGKYVYGGKNTATRFSYAKSKFPTDAAFSPVIQGDFNYGAVAVYTTSSRVYVYLAAFKYTTPLFTSTATPTISGSAKVGATLTAKTGTYKPAADTYTYQWKANGENIAGATSATYIVKPAEKGKKITVTVQGSKSGYAVPAPKTSAATKAIATGTMKISFTVEGKRNVGQQLYVDNDTVIPGIAGSYITSATIKWLRNGKAIPNLDPIQFDYTLTAADRGKKIDAQVTVKATGFSTAVVTKKTKTLTGYPLQTATPTPTISGTPAFAQVLTANPGTWDAGTKLSYQWYAGGKAISKATKSTYTVASSLVGKTITVKVTSVKSKFATASKTSAPTAAVASIPFATTGTIVVTGTQGAGKTLKVTPSGFSPKPTYSYQWYADGVAIKNAKSSSYKISTANASKFLEVKVTAKKAGYTTVVLSGGLL